MEKNVDHYLEKPKKKKKLDKYESRPGQQSTKAAKNFKIIDDDIDMNSLTPSQDAEILIDLLDPEGPVIADESVIQQEEILRSARVAKKIDMFTNNRWVKVNVFENEDGDLVLDDEQHSSVSSKSLFKKRGDKKKSNDVKTDEDDDDLDVPRKRETKKDSDGDLSPVRKAESKSKNEDDDLDDIRSHRKPQSQSIKRDADGDLSPVRKSSASSLSTEKDGRSRSRKKSDNDLSPVRKSSLSSTVVTVPKIKAEKEDSSDRRWSSKHLHIKKEKESPPDRKSSTSNSKENKKEEKPVHEIDDDRKISLRTKPKKEDEAKKAKDEELKRKYDEWKKGLVQIRQHEEKIKDYTHEMNKPLARHVDDKDLENILRSQEREDDPMLEYLKKNQESEGDKSQRKVYRGPPAPPNRYNIMPGSKWDGVDRSNGFEKKYFESLTARKVRQEEAYKWSTEDM